MNYSTNASVATSISNQPAYRDPQPKQDTSAPLAGATKRQRILKRGERLFEIASPFHSLYLVRSGSVKVYAVSDDGDEQVLGFYLPGDLVGLDALDAQYHGCAAVALETSSVSEIPVTRLDAMCENDPELQQSVNRMYGRAIARDHELLRLLGKKNAVERLAGFLVSMSRRFSELGFSASEFNLSMSRSDIGHLTGLAVETVSRLFSRLQDEGVLNVDRRNVRILDLQRLQGLA